MDLSLLTWESFIQLCHPEFEQRDYWQVQEEFPLTSHDKEVEVHQTLAKWFASYCDFDRSTDCAIESIKSSQVADPF